MNKQTVSLRLKYEILDEINRLMPKADVRTVSEFIITAIRECLDDEMCMKDFDEKMLHQGLP